MHKEVDAVHIVNLLVSFAVLTREAREDVELGGLR